MLRLDEMRTFGKFFSREFSTKKSHLNLTSKHFFPILKEKFALL